MKIGILRETKTPPDKRVPFTPEQCRRILDDYQEVELVIQPSENRCYADDEYTSEGLTLQEDLKDCDILFGVKEVAIPALLQGKTYLFFSHTAKAQPYNMGLLAAIIKKGITLLDYEYLTRKDRTRVVAFGKWAGIVGAYNGLKVYGEREGLFKLVPARQLRGLEEMKEKVKGLPLKNIRIVLTGGGRVAKGAVEILQETGLREVSPVEYLAGESQDAVYCRLDPWHYTRHIHELDFDFSHFVEHPDEYENTFLPYARHSDLFIACHFWDPEAPVMLRREDLMEKGLPLKVIADISCDINGPIASTIRASTIAKPVYGYRPASGTEVKNPFEDGVISVMAVDNLPGELPRDASKDFGEALLKSVIPALLDSDEEGIVSRAMIIERGELTDLYNYLDEHLKKN